MGERKKKIGREREGGEGRESVREREDREGERERERHIF